MTAEVGLLVAPFLLALLCNSIAIFPAFISLAILSQQSFIRVHKIKVLCIETSFINN